MATGNIESYGFWALLVVMLVRDLAIPLANKIIPVKVKAGITYEERVIVALESSNKNTASMIELMRQQATDHQTIITALTGQGKVLEVLVDRDKAKQRKSTTK